MESKAEAKDVSVGVEDLTKGAKRLRHADAPQVVYTYMASGSTNIKQEHVEEKTSPAELEPYVRLFHQHKGDLRAVFTVLGEDPGKALKYPPADAEEFSRVYTRGGYTYVPDAAKSPRK